MPSPLAPDQTQVSPLAAQNSPQQPAQSPAAPTYDMTNYKTAVQQMQLNPQEQALYQMHLENLHGAGGVDNPPTAENPQGSRSTLYQTTVEIDGKTFVIPTVWNGQIVSPAQAVQLAQQKGLDTFPSYASDQEAEARYQQMHAFMEKDTAAYMKNRKQ